MSAEQPAMAKEFTGMSVTGAGSGIGKATALLLAEEGASIVVVDLDQKAAEAAAEEITEAGGRGGAVQRRRLRPGAGPRGC